MSVIPLDGSNDARARDGGITRGFGGFTAYQVAFPPNAGDPCLLTSDKVAHLHHSL